MKKIEAIVRHNKLADVEHALERLGFEAMTITVANGLGREKGVKTIYRGGELAPRCVRREKLELIVEDERVDEAIDAIYQAAHTGKTGDGRILVVDIDTMIHIRTGESRSSLQPVGA